MRKSGYNTEMKDLSKRIGNEFIITTEIMPPRGSDPSDMLKQADIIRLIGKISAVNVIDSPSARLHMSSLGASIMLLQNGIEPIYQMVCRDRNSLALQSDLLSASAFGIKNVLALTGDHPARGASDHPFTRPVYDLDSTSLISAISGMNKGQDISKRRLCAPTSFTIGAAISPCAKPKEPEVLKVERKLSAGASFFQSQAVFDFSQMEAFMIQVEKRGNDIRKKTLIGLIPLDSSKMIGFLNSLPGIRVPQELKKRVLGAKDSRKEGIEACIESVDMAKSFGLGGAHIMPVGRISSLEKIVKNL